MFNIMFHIFCILYTLLFCLYVSLLSVTSYRISNPVAQTNHEYITNAINTDANTEQGHQDKLFMGTVTFV